MQTDTTSSSGGMKEWGRRGVSITIAQVGQSFHYSPEVFSRKHDHQAAEK